MLFIAYELGILTKTITVCQLGGIIMMSESLRFEDVTGTNWDNYAPQA